MNLKQPVDLHCHSNVSDGVLTPTELSNLMHAQGVKLFSLTDHDTTAGCEEAATRAEFLGMQFLPGVEVSSDFNDKSLHILGLGIDLENEDFQSFLSNNRHLRRERAEQILSRLEHFNIHIRDELSHFSDDESPGRTHFAAALVKKNYAKDKGEAFRRYLLKGGAAYVKCPWPGMKKTIDMIHVAGGKAILAHPGKYGYSLPGLRGLFRQFRDAGGDGAEVSSGPQALGVVQRLSQLCSKFSLMVSAGSDFHDPNSKWVRAGEYQQIPKRLTRIWQEMEWLIEE
ncbi:PHP domain-containing protein [Lentisphaera profundi]|uniref:PHP domain-containing protein n=1 Tax=Lentisphaera profundi TaxID=1658616 RepID=A0ABY7VZM5_9BACT|nr:PHP domain-containing protein [Lentisphaera profundi]WDE97468.1 PHP domain-containing protein [Lentisphaera profundi]